MLLILLLAIALLAVVRVPSVQTWLVSHITEYLSDELKTRVSIDAVDIRPFRHVLLKGFYIEDLQHDTLLYAPEFEASITGFNYKKNKIVFGSIDIDKARIKLIRYKDIKGLNFDFLADYFSSGTADSTSKSWDIKLKKINVNDAVFSYRDLRWNDATPCVDYEDMLISHLNVNIADVQPAGDSILFKLNHLSAVEKSGFLVKAMSGDMIISSHDLAINKMKLTTPFSDVYGNVDLNFDSWVDFDDFNNKIRLKTLFNKSHVASEDIRYFAKELIGLDKVIDFSGSVKGTVSNLKGKNLEIIYTPDCYFKGDIAMNGLPEFEETFIDLLAEDMHLNKKDIETINTYPFNEGNKIQLPPNISELGIVQFKGKFTGFYNDFVAYGDATSDLGYISSDVNLKYGDINKTASYSGRLVTYKFNIGKLLRIDPLVGEISANMRVKGHGLALEKLNTNLEGDVGRLVIKGYPYQGIKVNGHVERRLFKGALSVKDPNADVDFIGVIDYSKPQPVFDFSADINKAKLSVLNLLNRDESSNLVTKAEMHFTGNKLDDMVGSLHFSNTGYTEFPRGIAINNLYIESLRNNEERSITLKSDFADAHLEGKFLLSEVIHSALDVLGRYIPAIPVSKNKYIGKQSFDYLVEMKETRGVLDIFAPELSIVAGSNLKGHFNTLDNDFTAVLNSDEIIYKGIRFSGLHVDGSTKNNALAFSADQKEIEVNDSLTFRNVKLSGTTSRDSADARLIIENTDSSYSKADIDFDISFMNTGYTTVKVITNDFILERNHWRIDPANYILFDTTGVLFSNFNLSSGNQFVGINGIAGNDTTAKLKIEMKDFITSQLNSVLKYYNAEIGGIANGSIRFSSLMKKPYIESNLIVSSFSWYGDTLGDADVETRWNTEKSRIELTGLVTRGGEKNISVTGAYIIKKKNDEIDFTFSLRKTYIKTFSSYLRGIFSNISGIATGDVRLYGLAKAPELTGMLHLQKVGFTVDYLNTSYSLSTDVSLTENEIAFKDVTVFDSRGNKAIASGTVTHDHLKDFYFDIGITAKNVQMLNTSSHDNNLFYGMGYGTGNINITGYLDYIKMDIAMRTDKGTQISIPLNNPEEISQSSFITFMKSDTISAEFEKQNADLSGIELNMDFDVTTDATIKLIFDDKIGDVIEGRGTGTLTMKVNDADGFRMFGMYYIDQGQYTFTLQNIISKPFSIEKGGSISWTGDPYDANVSINAVYSKLRVNLYDLLQDTLSAYRKPMPVILRLKLSEKLFNPVIGFDIEVPNIDAATSSRINRYIITEEEKFKQAVSLLILRRFSPPAELDNRPDANRSSPVGSNAFEFASQQISNWASQINENVGVGINYSPGSALTQEELELALSTSLFNDRLVLEGNVGVANNSRGTTQNTSNIAGDFSAEVKASKDGRIRLKAFNRSNNNALINNLNSQYTQGIGVFYREEFNTFDDLIRKWRERVKRKHNSTAALPQ